MKAIIEITVDSSSLTPFNLENNLKNMTSTMISVIEESKDICYGEDYEPHVVNATINTRIIQE